MVRNDNICENETNDIDSIIAIIMEMSRVHRLIIYQR